MPLCEDGAPKKLLRGGFGPSQALLGPSLRVLDTDFKIAVIDIMDGFGVSRRGFRNCSHWNLA